MTRPSSARLDDRQADALLAITEQSLCEQRLGAGLWFSARGHSQ